ncbi:MAG TPA: hypothetical protein VFM37_14990 [Pseudonocardiaceae bacterium]|nr:hypothetical protein [Pseudonocardiaceae bacterium]
MTRPTTVTHAGAARRVCGWLGGVEVEPGTLLGPNDTGELMVALGPVDGCTAVGYATTADIAAAGAYLARGGAPRSVTETRLPRPPAPAGGAE